MTVSSIKVTRGFEYSYIHIHPTINAPVKYILFLHGFPSLAREWHHQIDHFSTLGYGIIAPDLLGYGMTSRPAELDAYTLKGMSQDIVEILCHENIEILYGVAHDVGAQLLSRLAVYHPGTVAKICFLTVGYNVLGQSFDIDLINKMTAEMLGYSLYGYIKFFGDFKAVGLLNEHQTSFASLIHSANPEDWRDHFAPLGGLQRWLETNSKATVGPWYSRDDMVAHQETFGRDGGYAGPLNWYKALVNNINIPDEKAMHRARYTLKEPVLFIGAAKDPIAFPDVQVQMMENYVSDLTVKKVDAAHWMQLEAPARVNVELERFFVNNEIS